MSKSAVKRFFGSLFEEEQVQQAADEAVEGEEGAGEGGELGGIRRSISLRNQLPSSPGDAESFQAIGGTNLYDPAYEKRVSDAIVAANLPGNDYFEFAVAVKAAMSDPEDKKPEDVAFRTTFKTIKSLDGVFSTEMLMSSSNTYIGVAERVYRDLKSETDEVIRLAKQDLDTLVKDMKKPLDALKDREAAAEIEQAINEKIEVRLQKVRAHQEGRLAKMNFVVERMVGELKKDQARIEQYLTKTTKA